MNQLTTVVKRLIDLSGNNLEIQAIMITSTGSN